VPEKLKIPIDLKKDMPKQITGYTKEVGRQAKAVETDKALKSVITCYNY
jgi:hypothetical protein